VRNLAGHEKPERIFRALVFGEIDQALIDDFGPPLGSASPMELNGETPPPPAADISGPASAAFRSFF
jgi:hypothetical protein